jgi:hypothetical protein
MAAESAERYCLQRRYGQAETFGREQGENVSQRIERWRHRLELTTRAVRETNQRIDEADKYARGAVVDR